MELAVGMDVQPPIRPMVYTTSRKASSGGGYSDADIRGILGGNFRRVLEEIWG